MNFMEEYKQTAKAVDEVIIGICGLAQHEIEAVLESKLENRIPYDLIKVVETLASLIAARASMG